MLQKNSKNIRYCGSLGIKPCMGWNFKNFLTSFFGKKIQKLAEKRTAFMPVSSCRNEHLL